MQRDTVRTVSPPDSTIAAIDSVYEQDFNSRHFVSSNLGGYANNGTIWIVSHALEVWPHSATINSQFILKLKRNLHYS